MKIKQHVLTVDQFLNEQKKVNPKKPVNEGLGVSTTLTKRNSPSDYVEELDDSLRIDGLSISDIEMGSDEGKFSRNYFLEADAKWATVQRAIISYVSYVQGTENLDPKPSENSIDIAEETEEDFWDRYEEEENNDTKIEMLEDEIGGVESDIEYLERTTDQNNKRENAGKISDLEDVLQQLKSELNYISR